MGTAQEKGRLRVAQVRKGTRKLEAGLVWVEVYLPFDVIAFADFCLLMKATGSAVAAAAADPALANRALTPVDSQAEVMYPEELQRLAHDFLTRSRRMDARHDEKERSSLTVVESFLNTPEIASPHFWPGAWVIVFRVDPGSPEWDDIESGELNAVSFQADVVKIPVYVKEEP